MDNLFTNGIIQLEQNPAEKDNVMLINIEIPANVKPSETDTKLEVEGQAVPLIAFALQAIIDAMANLVAEKSNEDKLDQKTRNQRWTMFTAHLVQFATDMCDVCGERHGLEIEGIKASMDDIETVYDVVKSVMEKRKEREEANE